MKSDPNSIPYPKSVFVPPLDPRTRCHWIEPIELYFAKSISVPPGPDASVEFVVPITYMFPKLSEVIPRPISMPVPPKVFCHWMVPDVLYFAMSKLLPPSDVVFEVI